MDKEMLEYYHNCGLMPDRYYYLQNGKTAEENYRDYKNKRFRISKQKMSLESFVLGILKSSLQATLNELLDDLIPKQ